MRYELIENCLNEKLAQSIVDSDYRLMLGRGAIITANYIERLKNYGVFMIAIEDDNTVDIVSQSVIPSMLVIEADKALNNIDVDRTALIADKIVKAMLDDKDNINNGFIQLKQYDENTATHSINVAILAASLGISVGLSYDRLKYLALGALLHDIGKSKVPIEILNKEGKLTDEEMELMREHPQFGYDMVRNDVLMPIPSKAIILQHHENWDGSGYPRKLEKDKIYKLASIVHICDVFDALVSQRSYKEAFSYKKSLDYIKSQRETMFSPKYIDVFFDSVPIFAVGLTVTLSDSSRGVVVKNNKGDMESPIVRVGEADIDLRESDLYIVS